MNKIQVKTITNNDRSIHKHVHKSSNHTYVQDSNNKMHKTRVNNKIVHSSKKKCVQKTPVNYKNTCLRRT